MQTSDRSGDQKETDGRVNVGHIERWASGIFGVLLLSGAFARRSILLGLAASAFLARSFSGHSALYARLGLSTARRRAARGSGERDVVDEASWESFPASDPPAYTDSGIGGPH